MYIDNWFSSSFFSLSPYQIKFSWYKHSYLECIEQDYNSILSNCKNKHHVQYLDISSAIRPIPHGPDVPVPKPDGNIKYSSDSEHSNMTVVAGVDAYNPEEDNQLVQLT